MIVKTTAIVLRINPFSRTSRVVTWLSPEYGRIVTVIKGACRPKSAFLGQYDLAMLCELLFYRRENDGIHIARECAPLAWRPTLRHDWRRAVTAGYLCELTNRVTMPQLEAAAIFELLEAHLTALEHGASPQQVVVTFELALLTALGLAPDFSPCPDCLAPGNHFSARFSLPAGRLRCRHTTPLQPDEASVSLDPTLLLALRQWQHHSLQPATPPPAASDSNLLAIRRFLYMFLQHHLDTPLAAHQATFAWLEQSQNQ